MRKGRGLCLCIDERLCDEGFCVRCRKRGGGGGVMRKVKGRIPPKTRQGFRQRKLFKGGCV